VRAISVSNLATNRRCVMQILHNSAHDSTILQSANYSMKGEGSAERTPKRGGDGSQERFGLRLLECRYMTTAASDDAAVVQAMTLP